MRRILDPTELEALAEVLAEPVAQRVLDRLGEVGGEDRWLTSAEAARYLGMTMHAFHRHTAAGTIPCAQDGPGCKMWFKRADLDAWRTGARRLTKRGVGTADDSLALPPA